jgi:hypothetical protein
MKIYDTNYGPDTFGRIRMGLITEMFLNFEGYMMPETGDHLRISCTFKGVTQDVYTVCINKVSECCDEPETVLIQIAPLSPGDGMPSLSQRSSEKKSNTYRYH